MFKIIKFTSLIIVSMNLSFCKSENKSKVDKIKLTPFVTEMLTKAGIKKLLPEYDKYADILPEVFQIITENSKNGRKITIPRFSESSQKLLGEEDWLYKFLNPNSPWRDTYKGPLKNRPISEFMTGNEIDYILSDTVKGDANLAELIDFNLATDPIENITQKLGLKAYRSTSNRLVTSISMPDAALLNTNIRDFNNELLLQGKIAQKDFILELPPQMLEREIRSKNPEEYLFNFANQGIFELDQRIGTPYNLSKPLYRVHQLLGISQEIYNQNRELAKRSVQYITFMRSYIQNKSTTKPQKKIAQYCLDEFIKTIQPIIDANLKNAGKVEYFTTHPKMAKAFFSTDYILKDYIRSLYDSSYFNKSLDTALKDLFILQRMPSEFRNQDIVKTVYYQIDLFAAAYPQIKVPIMDSMENSEDIFERSAKRKNLLERSIIESQNK